MGTPMFVVNTVNENLGYLRNRLDNLQRDLVKARETVRNLIMSITEHGDVLQETLTWMAENDIAEKQ